MAEDQKLENLLNLAVEATEEEREKSGTLEVGYNPQERTWEVIVRYSGDLSGLPEQWQMEPLSGGYAIVTLPQSQLAALSALPQIEYIEKPKRLYFSVNLGRSRSCVSGLQTGPEALNGRGVLVAVIDSGVDYFHPDFRKEDGTTRIRAIWDQSAAEEMPGEAGREAEGEISQGVQAEINRETQSGTGRETQGGISAGEQGDISPGAQSGIGREMRGREYTQEEINRALAAGNREAGYRIVPEQDFSGHGTEVLGIAAGNGRSSGGRYRGMAPESELLIVKLGTPQPDGFPRTTELMRAVEYAVRKAEELRMPLALNLSFGNVYGSHEPCN